MYVRVFLNNNGLGKDEPQELLMQTALYCGLPANRSSYWAEANFSRQVIS